MTDEAVTEALRVAKLGPVFPVFGVRQRDEGSPFRCACGSLTCGSPGKHPVGGLVPRGLKDATQDPARIRRWWPSSHNLGFVTGAVVVLDVDQRHDGYRTLDAIEAQHGAFAPTWCSETGGGGRHLLFRAPPGRVVQNSAGKLGSGIDVRGTGGFIVAPPSRHVSGRQYCWSVDHHPDEVPLAEMPEWLVDLCAAPVVPTASMPGARFDATWFVGDGIVEGARNARLTSLCGYLLRRLPPSDARLVAELVLAFNATRCAPPLPHSEVMRLINSVCGRELRRRCAA